LSSFLSSEFVEVSDSCTSFKLVSVDSFSEVSVLDNGKGIDIEKQKKIFNFENGYTENGTEGEKGTGLGLKLCKEFTKLHNSDIKVESTPNIGSTFSFDLEVF